nr:MAG TPA: Mannosyl-glycoprotein endo-beta-N-acetylglucosaminidase [Crassvirales sp.]
MKQKVFNVLISLVVGALGAIQVYSCSKRDKPPEIKVALHIDNKEKQPDFFSKSPQEGLMEALEYYGVKHPQIVYAQAFVETGNFKSDLCLSSNNLFGLYNSSRGRYHRFDHWTESVIAYKDFIQRRYKPPEDYYKFLQRIGYAGDPNYISKLKKVVNKNDKRRSE